MPQMILNMSFSKTMNWFMVHTTTENSQLPFSRAEAPSKLKLIHCKI